jgi:excisionase family DNA binding protein
MPDDLFTIRQVARKLRVGEKQVRLWVREGELTVIDLGDATRSKHRISERDLQKFLESRRVVKETAVAAHNARRKAPKARQWF